MGRINDNQKSWRLSVNKLLGYKGEDPSQAMKNVWGASFILKRDLEKMPVEDAVANISRLKRDECLKAYNISVRGNPDWRRSLTTNEPTQSFWSMLEEVMKMAKERGLTVTVNN